MADVQVTGEANWDDAGRSVAGDRDIDSDGLDDICVGAPANDSGGTDAGAAYLLLGFGL